jgi:hypothetical protein
MDARIACPGTGPIFTILGLCTLFVKLLCLQLACLRLRLWAATFLSPVVLMSRLDALRHANNLPLLSRLQETFVSREEGP